MASIDGATLIARNLKQQGVQYMFGVVGFPVFGIAQAAQREGIMFIGMRNEQSASYAAQAAGYLTGSPQACLVVSGPGVVHALAGLANAQQNCWPMILIGGASPSYQNGMGAFQEERQVGLAEPFCKFAHAVESINRIPYYVEKAIRCSKFGRPGPTYLDLADDVIRAEIEAEEINPAPTVGEAPRGLAHEDDIESAISTLESAERPLVIVGKGMAWSRAEEEVRRFIERTQLPFLASPMGKGILPDEDSLSVGAARSHALKEADVVFLMGARFNWIMHFGLPPRFSQNVRVVQLDISPEEIGHNVAAEVGLVGDGKAIMGQINDALDKKDWRFPEDSQWRVSLKEKAEENSEAVRVMTNDDSSPMNYYRAYKDIVEWLPDNAIIVGEGANTMDIGRTQMANSGPRQRLDAGTYGTMGVGLGYLIAAAVVHPDRPVIGVQGDSAFGFSGMELETICRYKLPVKLVILNNGGIGSGLDSLPTDSAPPPEALLPKARYDGIMTSFGGKGIFVEQTDALPGALEEAMAFDGPALINVCVHPKAGRKPQKFEWLTT